MNTFVVGMVNLGSIAPLVLGWYHAKKRRDALQNVAMEMGYLFDPEGKTLRKALSQNLHIFTLGSSRKIQNTMRGWCAAGEVTLFEFQYTEGGGQKQVTHHETIAAFRLPNISMPDFYLGPGHWWHKVGSAFGAGPITFPWHPQFAKRYLLRGPNESAIRQFFGPSLLEYLLSLPDRPEWSLEASSPWLLVYSPFKRCKPEEIASFRDSAAAIASNVAAGLELRRSAQAG
jgi:hypothetical protein